MTKLAFIDFEATCDIGNGPEKGPKLRPQEIIEFSVVLYDTDSKKTDQFQSYVRPIRKPILTEYCVNLTGITQEQVSKARPFNIVWSEFLKWFNRKLRGGEVLFTSCGNWDLSIMLPLQHKFTNNKRDIPPIPEVMKRWCDIRQGFKQLYDIKQTIGLQKMLDHLEMEFIGRPHS